jgi:hypothetical protein
MTQGSLAQQEPGLTEQPSPSAQLKLEARMLGTAEGIVPPGEAHHLVTTFGMVGSCVTGVAGAVLTLRIDRGLVGIALAELVLALAIAMLIAACGRHGDQTRG